MDLRSNSLSEISRSIWFVRRSTTHVPLRCYKGKYHNDN
ncbi:hypothetical protein PPL_08657 [Heterostelium album PN500]|uniref:Uncharacterized protein n=1 Tax=Heterostelium pallidum (strain ATCC 26659 / Pp 5 / PN500) TaxID=670386 RepID=D3BJD2_HETP5|nr:hypothetical protein PPL_08657 [Heterostelium album PN500]EFA78012.1 hypothetical protein PPL_08657 [Heterostelium album PN500]|eukprot:XP_020430140.1 hypothetical protein PPL_08657 [Heterostelium album PN500]